MMEYTKGYDSYSSIKDLVGQVTSVGSQIGV